MNINQFVKIKESIINLRKDLGSRNTLLILYSLCALLTILILLFVYRPLALKLGAAEEKYQGLQAQLLEQRKSVAGLKDIKLEGRLMQQKEASRATDELTEKGKNFGLRFSSVTQREWRKQTQENFKALPVDFKIKSGYKNLGQFFAYIEEFPRTLSEVSTSSIRPNEENPAELDVELLINLYMQAEDAEKR
ncbi:MAG: type 4a pilus biogenesis protein PilO [Candidatus Omnitrophica bacterium]|nr:type 4a pilus biogenesis protein PilO [Candidatus Omnitrophota bacterium]